MEEKNVNKVIINGETVIDLTSDTVSEENLLLNETAHDSSGKKIFGTYVPPATEYTAGDGIKIENHEISVDETVAKINALPSEIFHVFYARTIYEDIKEAFDAGKLLVFHYGASAGAATCLLNSVGGDYFNFHCMYAGVCLVCACYQRKNSDGTPRVVWTLSVKYYPETSALNSYRKTTAQDEIDNALDARIKALEDIIFGR